jgi:hypothetical protein
MESCWLAPSIISSSWASQEGSSYTYTRSREGGLRRGSSGLRGAAHALLRLQSLPNQPAWPVAEAYQAGAAAWRSWGQGLCCE